ncbi:MAG: O-antigen ligase family protein [Gemmatimonadaceae bacterium]
MSALLLCGVLAFSIFVALNFRGAVLLYLGLYQVIPITLSIDLGTSLPLITVTRMLLLPLLAGFVIRVLSGRLRLDHVPFLMPLAFFGCALLAANVLSEFPNAAGWLNLSSFITEKWAVSVIAASVIRTRRDGEAALTMLFLGAVASLLFAGYELAADKNPLLAMAAHERENLIYNYALERRFGLRRIQSLFRNPLDYGIYLSLLLPLAAWYRHVAAGWRRWLSTTVLLGGTVAVALTMSRTPIYSVIVSSIVYLAVRRRWATLFRSVATAVGLVVVVTIAFGFPLRDYLYESAVAPEQFSGELGGSSLSSLVNVTRNHLELAVDHPLFGRGPGTLPPAEAGGDLDPRQVGFGEQGYSYLLVETGLVGFVAFVWILGSIGRRMLRGWRVASTAFGRGMSLATLCALVGWAVSIELAGLWHFSLLLVIAAITARMQEIPQPVPKAHS